VKEILGGFKDPDIQGGPEQFRKERLRQVMALPPILAATYGDGVSTRTVMDEMGNEVKVVEGDAKIHDLNLVAQAAINPPHRWLKERKIGKTVYRECDRLMWLRNMELTLTMEELVNGQECYILEIDDDPDLGVIIVLHCPQPDGGFTQPRIKLDEFEATLGYSASCNKSQGSEWPWGIVIAHPGVNSARSWWYTSTTRFKEGIVIIGQTAKTFSGHTRDQNRRTQLREFIAAALRRPDTWIEEFVSAQREPVQEVA
jgi:ATP-dependent exoDNAse (exonuclease V) alpha subunit